MRFLGGGAVLLLLLSSGALEAQMAERLEPGARVRVTYLCGDERECREKGTVMTTTADSIELVQGRLITGIPVRAVTRLEVRTGRRVSAGRAVGFPVLGFAGGGLVGGVIGYGSCAPCDYELEGLAVVFGAALGAGIGFATGLVAGLVPRDTWEDASLDRFRIGVAPGHEGRLQFGVSLSF